MKEIKYKLTVNDYLNNSIYAIRNDSKGKKIYNAWRVFVTLLIGLLSFIYVGLTGNAWVLLFYLILLLPIWFLTKKVYKKIVEHKIKRFLKYNPVYLAESSIIIEENSLIKKTAGVTTIFPLSKIKSVIQDKDNDLIYIEFSDGVRIVPFRAFPNEVEKAIFLDLISIKQEN